MITKQVGVGCVARERTEIWVQLQDCTVEEKYKIISRVCCTVRMKKAVAHWNFTSQILKMGLSYCWGWC